MQASDGREVTIRASEIVERLGARGETPASVHLWVRQRITAALGAEQVPMMEAERDGRLGPGADVEFAPDGRVTRLEVRA